MTHTLVVEPDPVTILEGVVEDAHGPVPGAVVFQPPGPDGFDPPEFGPHGPPVLLKPSVTTDHRGRFVFWVAGPGRVELRVRTQLGAFASRFWRWHLGAPTKPPNRKVVRLRIGHGSIVGRLSLGKREGYATVHLFPADTADCDAFYGGPLLGVLPYADKLPYFTRKANGDRPFRFDNLDAGAYVLRVRNDKNQTVTQRVIDLELDDSVDLGPVKEDPSTEVRVRGDLYPSRHITIYRHLPDDPPHRRRAHISTHRLRPANANEDHSASLATMTTRLAPGSYEAVLAPKLILPFQVSRSGKVEPEELSANIGGVEGKIPEVDLRHFQCRVRLQREDGGPSLETTLRPDGTFWRDGLTPGRYRVLLDRIGGSPYTGQLESMTRAPEPTPLFVGSRPWPHTQSIRIVRGKRIALQLESPPTDWITGLVTANGRPVADAVVAASPVAAPDRELVRTGKDGRFRLAIAGPGRWVVSAEAKGRTATRHLERGASPTTREHPTHLLLPLTQPPRWR